MLERETSTTLPQVSGMEVAPYIDRSMARIRNAAIRHRCHQIGTDGSQKIVQRLIDPLRERLAAGRPAGLAHPLGRRLDRLRSERRASFRSPLDAVATLMPRPSSRSAKRAADWSELAKAVLAIAPIFGTDMARPDLIEPVARHLRGLLDGDARAYLEERLSDE